MSQLICPACEVGDHEHSWLCEKDYKCACPCHGKPQLPRDPGDFKIPMFQPRVVRPLAFIPAIGVIDAIRLANWRDKQTAAQRVGGIAQQAGAAMMMLFL